MSSKSTKKQTNIDIKNKQKEYNEIGLDRLRRNIVSIDEVPFYREMVSLKGWGKEGKKLRSGVIAESDAPSVKNLLRSVRRTFFFTRAKKVNIF